MPTVSQEGFFMAATRYFVLIRHMAEVGRTV